jgi:putative membrane protein
LPISGEPEIGGEAISQWNPKEPKGAKMKKTYAVLAIGLAGALVAGTAMAQTSSPANSPAQAKSQAKTQDKMAAKTADRDSQKFIKAAIEGDIAEIDVGKLAQEKGQSEAVKQYGAMLVKDHGEHKAKAEEVASQLGVTPPTGSSFGEKATYAKLKLLSGESFDRSFAKSMVADHQDDIKEFRKEASKNDAAGQLAKETLPTLRKHLQAAQRLTTEKQSPR